MQAPPEIVALRGSHEAFSEAGALKPDYTAVYMPESHGWRGFREGEEIG